MNQALLLSPEAEIDTKPELEIFADDVKCSHGATVGELDPEQMFYLRSPRHAGSRGARDPGARLPRRGAGARSAHEPTRAALEAAVATLVGAGSGMNDMTHPSPSMSNASAHDFPILRQTVRGKPLVFLDSAASAQKPRAVIEAMAARDGDAIRQRPSRPALDERAHHRRLRGRARCRRAADERAPTGTRSCSSATAPRRSTWSRTATAAACCGPARRC